MGWGRFQVSFNVVVYIGPMRRIHREIVSIDGLTINSALPGLSREQRQQKHVSDWTPATPRQAPVSSISDSVSLSGESTGDDHECEELCSNLLAAWG